MLSKKNSIECCRTIGGGQQWVGAVKLHQRANWIGSTPKSYKDGCETTHAAVRENQDPFYKIVAVDSRKARNAQPIEYLGTWDPLPDKDGRKSLRLSEDRVKYWLTVGAQPSDAVAKLVAC